jgi:rSAM/selenodomain-associated transferase 1
LLERLRQSRRAEREIAMAPSIASTDRFAIAVMAKASEPGRVKTRLVPPLTIEEAARLNTCFLADICDNILAAAQDRPIDGYVAYASKGSESFFRANLSGHIKLLPPREPGLGPSLRHAMADLLAAGHAGACLVNSDSPTLPTHFLLQAIDALQQSPERVVLGPSEDGGYYLIGCRQRHDRLFEDIAWSTERVLPQTIARAGEIGLEVVQLPPWYDVDDAATLMRLRRELLDAPHTEQSSMCYSAPHTRSFLASSAIGALTQAET